MHLLYVRTSWHLKIVLPVALYPSYLCCIRVMGKPSNYECLKLVLLTLTDDITR